MATANGNPRIVEQTGSTPELSLSTPSAGVVEFGSVYSSGCFALRAFVVTDVTGDPAADVDVALTGLSSGGFSYVVGGGAPGSTGRILWRAIGS